MGVIGVDHAAISARESCEGNAGRARNANGKRGGSGNGGEQTNAGHGRLLYHFVAGATGDDREPQRGIDAARSQRADEFVQRVVAAHIFAQVLNFLRQD